MTATDTHARQWRHDVRTPLNHVLGYGELVRDSLDGGSPAAAPLQALLGEARTLLRGLESGDPHPAPAQATSRAARKDEGARAARLQAMQRQARAARAILAQQGQAELVADIDKVLSGLQALERALGQSPARTTAPPAPPDALPAGSRTAGEDSAAMPRPQPATVPAAHPAGVGTVLVVDDDAGNRELLARAVTALGHQVLQADDGSAALATLHGGAVDLMLLDLRMPGMDGHAVLQALHADESLRAMPVLVVSGDDDRESVLRCIEAGAVDYLPKPAEPAILRARIGACLAAKRLHDQAEQLHAQRAAMLAGISHDLRQPLQAVRMYGDTLRRHVDAGGRELLARQQRAADAAVEMLDRFADFSALALGAIVPRPASVELLQLAREVCEHVAAAQDAQSVSIRIHGRETWAHTDRGLMTRILQNLLGNAVRCTAAAQTATGRDRPRVVLALRRQGGSVVFDVVDNGPGFPATVAERLFEPYQRSAHGGSRGLGLAIVAGLCRQLGMEPPALRTTPGRGSSFRLHLPDAAMVAAPAAEPGADAVVGPEQIGTLAGWLIGVLDDEAVALDATVRALKSEGASCIASTDAECWRERLHEAIRFPDAVVVDLDLGNGGNGLEIIGRLRRDWDSGVPAIVVTGGGATVGSLPVRCTLLRKPTRLADLVIALRRLQRS